MHAMKKVHSLLCCNLFFFLNKIIIIVIPQASIRYLISDLVFFSSNNEAEQSPTREDGQDVIGCSAFSFSLCRYKYTSVDISKFLLAKKKKGGVVNFELKEVSVVFFVCLICLLHTAVQKDGRWSTRG